MEFVRLSVLATVLSSLSPAAGFALPAPAPEAAVELRSGLMRVPVVWNDAYEGNGTRALIKAYRKWHPSHYKQLYIAGDAVEDFDAHPSSLIRAAQPGGGKASVIAKPEFGDSEYLSPMSVGGQQFMVDFDTGSADLWLISKSAGGRGKHKGYDPSISGVAKRAQGQWRIEYGDGSGASGSVVYDTVAVGPVVVRNQAVEVANTISTVFVTDNADGLLGLALTKINQVKPTPQTTFFENAVPALASPVFAVHLRQKAAGSYDFGFIDDKKFKGPLHWVDVDATSGFWQFDSKSYVINGQVVPYSAGRAIIDTGTTLLLAPASIVKAYYAEVPGAVQDDSAGGFIFPCDAKLPSFAVAVGNYHAYIPPKLLNFNQVSSSKCFGGLQAQPQLPGSQRSIFGDVLLKAFYSVFELKDGKHRMGIAPQP